MNIWLSYLIDSVAFGVTFIYGSTGEILTEKAGHLNLGIPGIMCMGGAGGCLVLNTIGKLSLSLVEKGMAPIPGVVIVLAGILGAILMSMLMGLIYSFLTVTLRANQNVTGLVLTTFGTGLMKVIMSNLDHTIYLEGPKALYRWPFHARTDSLLYLGVLFFLSIIIALLASYILYKTKIGLHLRAVGESPSTADAVGVNVTKYKYLATIIGSAIAGLGGFYYIVDYSGSREAYLSIEAYGWMAIALVIFALWRPHLTIIGSIVFGFLFSCGAHIVNIEGIKITLVTTYLLKMLPYICTIIVLIFTSIRNKRENQPPASLGLPYFREDR